jgi:hypothetical protein
MLRATDSRAAYCPGRNPPRNVGITSRRRPAHRGDYDAAPVFTQGLRGRRRTTARKDAPYSSRMDDAPIVHVGLGHAKQPPFASICQRSLGAACVKRCSAGACAPSARV